MTRHSFTYHPDVEVTANHIRQVHGEPPAEPQYVAAQHEALHRYADSPADEHDHDRPGWETEIRAGGAGELAALLAAAGLRIVPFEPAEPPTHPTRACPHCGKPLTVMIPTDYAVKVMQAWTRAMAALAEYEALAAHQLGEAHPLNPADLS